MTTDSAVIDEDGRTRRGAPAVRWGFCLSARPEIARMNQCPACNADPHQLCYGRTFSRRRTVNHSERKAFAITIANAAMAAHRTYVDALNTSNGALVSSPACEHCDGEKSAWVRNDHLRSWVCPVCDDALDEMLGEQKEATPAMIPTATLHLIGSTVELYGSIETTPAGINGFGQPTPERKFFRLRSTDRLYSWAWRLPTAEEPEGDLFGDEIQTSGGLITDVTAVLDWALLQGEAP